jgi:predicted Zn-dependent protease
MYKEKKMNEIVYLLEGYQHLMQKDLKPGLNLIERSIQAGLYEPIAMVLLARFLNKAGYPKRTIGICEKLLKKSFLKATEVYPILVEAYRMQGKEKEAAAVEERYKDCE